MNRQSLVECLELRRMLSAGDLDGGFGKGGFEDSPLGRGQIVGVLPASNGKLIIANTVGDEGHGDFQIARLSATGKINRTFGDNGIATIDFGGDEQLTSIYS